MTRVGQVLGAHGTDGAVKVLSLTDFDDRFQRGARLMLEGDERTVEWSRAAGGELVVKLKGIDDRTMAKHIRGRYLEVGEEAARPAAEGRFRKLAVSARPAVSKRPGGYPSPEPVI